MNSRFARLLVYFYPSSWRKRYGKEFETLLQSEPTNIRTLLDVVFSALREHVLPSSGENMNEQKHLFGVIVRQPTAFLPIAMSLTALTVVLVTVTFLGAGPKPADEGAAAHIWQLLMAGQLPLLAIFAIRWLPRAPRQTLYVFALQVVAILASIAPVFFLHL